MIAALHYIEDHVHPCAQPHCDIEQVSEHTWAVIIYDPVRSMRVLQIVLVRS